MAGINEYITGAVEAAADALLEQATDVSSAGNGFSVTGDTWDATGRECGALVVEKVPYLTEAVTAFVKANHRLLVSEGISPAQCGHDFILTSNHGFGAGFWSRDLGSAERQLAEGCEGYSFDAEYIIDDNGEVTFLVVENIVLVDTEGLAS